MIFPIAVNLGFQKEDGSGKEGTSTVTVPMSEIQIVRWNRDSLPSALLSRMAAPDFYSPFLASILIFLYRSDQSIPDDA